MKIDVVIPTCNRQDIVTKTLRSLLRNTIEDFHVWVVDQSDDGVTEQAVRQIADQDARITYLRSQEKGVNIARNMGIAAGEAPIVALTDDDCEVAEDWLASLLAEYEAYPECDSVFGQIEPVSVPETAVSPELFKEMTRLQQILPMAFIDATTHHVFADDRFDLGFGHGANMSFRRSTFAKFGFFDEFLGAGAPLHSWPERDMGYRILAGGGKILYSPNVLVFHSHWRSWPSVKKTFRNYGFGTGAAIGKYIRTGDWGSVRLFNEWLVQMGFRQIFSGLLKWQSWRKTYVGLQQLIYPWVGLWHSRQYEIDAKFRVYVGKKEG